MSFHAGQTFTFGEQPSATKWQYIWDNDYALADGSGISDSVIGNRQLAVGTPVQMKAASFTAVATGTTLLPHDDTIPQITEGTEFMTLSFTPKASTNILIIEAKLMLGISVNSYKGAALFQDAVANGLAGDFLYQGNWTDPAPLTIYHSMVAGTTSAITFRVRAGGELAGTITFNGSLGARYYGATTKSAIIVTEVKV